MVLMRKAPKAQSTAGFTLLEILVALVITAILFGSLFSVYSTSLDVSKHADRFSRQYQTLRLVLGQVRKDLKCLYYPSSKDKEEPGPFEFLSGDSRYIEDQEGNREIMLQFATKSGLDFNATFPGHSIYQVRYLTQSKDLDTEAPKVLIRQQKPFPGISQNFHEVELADNVQHIEFRFIDDQGNEHTSWESFSNSVYGQNQQSLPREIILALSLLDESGSEVSKEMSVAVRTQKDG